MERKSYKNVNKTEVPIYMETKNDSTFGGITVNIRAPENDYYFNYYNRHKKLNGSPIIPHDLKNLFGILTNIMHEHQEYIWDQESILFDENAPYLVNKDNCKEYVVVKSKIKENLKKYKYKKIRPNRIIDNISPPIPIIEHPYIVDSKDKTIIDIIS